MTTQQCARETPPEHPTAAQQADVDALVERYRQQDLIDRHIYALIARGVASEIAAARGVFTARTKQQLADLGFSLSQRQAPALVIPLFNTVGDLATYMIRPDKPRVRDGKTLKYELPRGSQAIIDVPPLVRSKLADPTAPLFVTEGPLKADAAASCNLVCVALLGVWSYARSETLLADWDNVALKNRDVYIVFDSDVMTKQEVYRALYHLKGFLEHRHARVRVVYLSPGADGSKVGLDDYLASDHTVDALLALAEDTLRDMTQVNQRDTIGNYRQSKEGIVYLKPTREGTIVVPITNFPARIVADLVFDDGSGETQRQYEIEVVVCDRRHRITVPVSQFAGMTWSSELGPQAILSAGMSVKDHAREAIQRFSTDVVERRIYTHTGWQEVDGRSVYLTASGGIDQNGRDTSLTVQLQGHLSAYALPDPPAGERLCTALRASLSLLDLTPDAIMVPLLGAAYRAPLGAAHVGLHLYGETGNGKTQLAAIVQQHFGAGMDAEHLPAGWSSTDNALEAVLHAAKDAVCTVDDFVYKGGLNDVARINRTADRVFRAQGNNAGRLRMRPDGTLVPARSPRGIVLSTGEERPRGQSLGARRFDLEVSEGMVDWEKLSEYQREAASGLYADALAGYVSWLAGRYTRIHANLQKEMAELRTHAAVERQHRRTPTIIAQLALGWQYFLQFAFEAGAIEETKRDELWARIWKVLHTVGASHHRHQEDSDPVTSFLDLLRSSINSGQAHVAGPDGAEPERPGVWGWIAQTLGIGENERSEWRPQGTRVGWIEGDEVYLDATSAHYTAQRIATASGYPLSVELSTLKKRLHERGHLASIDERRGRFDVRKTLQGKRVPVLHLHADVLFPNEVSHVSHLSLDLPDTARSGDGVLPFCKEGEHVISRSGTDGTHGTPSATTIKVVEHEVQNQPSQSKRVCMVSGHAETWIGLDGQDICTKCHPKPQKAAHGCQTDAIEAEGARRSQIERVNDE